jgi:hypothetical protein
MMSDKLVATGDNDADAYLHIAREVRVWAAALRLAEECVADGNRYEKVPWQRAETERNPVGYTLAADVVVLAPVAIDSARARACQHLQAVRARDGKTADLVAAHVAHLFGPEPVQACGETRDHDWLTFTCTRPEGHNGGHADQRRRACWIGDSPATDLQGRPLLKGSLQPSKSDPRAFRRRRSSAANDAT